jgi:hypothetical protein
MKKIALFISLVFLSSWGFLAHKTIHQIAIYSLPKKLQGFFYKNMDYMIYNSVRPDVRRKDDKTEDTKHYIDIDAPVFGPNALETMPESWAEAKAKYTEDTLRKYGTVCWEILFLKEKLTRAFKNKQKDSILFYAADMGHYIADAHVPLHTSINYDGQMTGQRGIHSLWESVVPEIHIADYNLYQNHKATYLKSPQTTIWKSFRVSFSMLKTVLDEEKNASEGFTDKTKYKRSERYGKMRQDYTGEFAKAYAKRLGDTVNERMLESSRCVADFWFTCWVDAGCPNLKDISELTDEEKTKLGTEITAWKANELIKKDLLQAKKVKEKE